MAIIMPSSPAGGGDARLADSTSSTDTEDMFPFSHNDFRVLSSAASGRSRTLSTASITYSAPAKSANAATTSSWLWRCDGNATAAAVTAGALDFSLSIPG